MAVVQVQLPSQDKHAKFKIIDCFSPTLLLCRRCKVAPSSKRSRATSRAMHLPSLDMRSWRWQWMLVCGAYGFDLLVRFRGGYCPRFFIKAIVWMCCGLHNTNGNITPTLGLKATSPYMPPACCKLVTASLAINNNALERSWNMRHEHCTFMSEV